MEQDMLTLLKHMDEKMDKQFEQMNKKMDKRFEQMDIRFSRVEGRLDKIEERIDKIEVRLDKIEERIDKIEKRLDKVENRLDQHERLLESLIKMTAQNTEDITALRTETNERFDKLELSYYKMTADINLLFQESQTNKRDIALLKNQ